MVRFLLPLTLALLPSAFAQTNELKLLQQYTQNPKTLGTPQVGDWSVTYMKFDTPLGFTSLVHLKGKPKAWVIRVEDSKTDLLKAFPNRTKFKAYQAGDNSTTYYKVTGGPFKGKTLEVIQDAGGGKRYALITPEYATLRKLTF